MGVQVYLEDARAMRFCTRGLREGFARHNLDWGDFLKNGIDSDVLQKAVGDNALVEAVVEVARGRRE